jgi:hypothetical protein
LFDTQAMLRGDHVNIKIMLNRNQNTSTGFLGATRRASITSKNKITVVKELFVMK